MRQAVAVDSLQITAGTAGVRELDRGALFGATAPLPDIDLQKNRRNRSGDFVFRPERFAAVALHQPIERRKIRPRPALGKELGRILPDRFRSVCRDWQRGSDRLHKRITA
ncbi:MAG TPA: hypothetical protein VM755_03645 [Stellaceae bacterium]|nr:hypothetical protein [Stellaceae bacterium]